jgi:hypothetical protein
MLAAIRKDVGKTTLVGIRALATGRKSAPRSECVVGWWGGPKLETNKKKWKNANGKRKKKKKNYTKGGQSICVVGRVWNLRGLGGVVVFVGVCAVGAF